MSKLVRWNVPFAGESYPSVSASFKTPTVSSSGELEINIGLADGALYQIRSADVLAFTCFDESCSPKRWFSNVETDQVETCAYRCQDSPWVDSYRSCQHDSDGKPIPLNHYLIYGGDNIVEFLCQHEPTISKLIE